MDTGSIVAIVLATVAIVPQVLGYITQGKKDEKQSELDNKNIAQQATTAAQSALQSVIQPMQDALTRCQDRIKELEELLVEKTTRIGELMQQNIDKDSSIAIMKYKMESLQMKLTDFINEEALTKGKTAKTKRRKEDTVPLEIRAQLDENESKKAVIAEETTKMVEAIKSKSITNGNKPDIGISEIGE